jgi:hypothetical protein
MNSTNSHHSHFPSQSKVAPLASNGVTDLVVVCFDSAALTASNADSARTSFASDGNLWLSMLDSPLFLDAFIASLVSSVTGPYTALFLAQPMSGAIIEVPSLTGLLV